MKKESIDKDVLKFKHEWNLAPGQLLNITFSDPKKTKEGKVSVPAIVKEVHFSKDTPEATVLFWNRWNSSNSVSGSIELRCSIHRYLTDMTEETIDFFKEIYKNDGNICGFNESHGFDRVFYIEGDDIIYPIDIIKEEQLKEEE